MVDIAVLETVAVMACGFDSHLWYMISKVEIEKLDFTHLGSRWWKNEDDSIRLRQWKGDEIDIWRWGIRESEQFKVFQGTLVNIGEIKWVLDKL